MSKYKILQLLPTFGDSAGGVGTVAKAIVEGMDQANFDVGICDIGNGKKYQGSYSLFSLPKAYPIALMELSRQLSRVHVTHLHGVWHPLSALLLGAKLGKRIPHVCSPHGMLAEWIVKRGRMKKAVARLLYERWHWNRVDCFHALSTKEAGEIRAIVPKARIAIIPNGVKINVPVSEYDREVPVILYLGRFHEKKGLRELFEAWRTIKSQGIPGRLKIVGWGDFDFGAIPSDVSVLPPEFDEEKKADLIKQSKFLILPSLSEGLPMVILEAWSNGTPTIMTRECNLPGGFDRGASLETTSNPESIEKVLKRALAMSDSERDEYGAAAWNYCAEEFSMDSVSHKFMDLYSFLMGNNDGKSINFFPYGAN